LAERRELRSLGLARPDLNRLTSKSSSMSGGCHLRKTASSGGPALGLRSLSRAHSQSSSVAAALMCRWAAMTWLRVACAPTGRARTPGAADLIAHLASHCSIPHLRPGDLVPCRRPPRMPWPLQSATSAAWYSSGEKRQKGGRTRLQGTHRGLRPGPDDVPPYRKRAVMGFNVSEAW